MSNQAYTIGLKMIGRDVTIWPLAKIVSPEVVSVGDSVIIDDFVFIMGGKGTVIGSFVHIASFTSVTGGGEFCMEDFSTLSSGVRVLTGTDDFSGACLTNSTVPSPYRLPTRSFVTIRKHAILGANAVILPGVQIGEGAAIGANSLVTKDCDPWMTYAGTPARVLGPRRRDRIEQLETELRKVLYDAAGRYIPADEREQQ